MSLKNTFLLFQKRILHSRLTMILLAVIILLTATYILLPSKVKTSDLKVAIISYDDSINGSQLLEVLATDNSSIYTFYEPSNEDALIDDIGRGKAECGYVIPSGFIQSFIDGTAASNQITQYITPGTTLAESINELLYSYIFELASEAILINTVGIDELNDELIEALNNYKGSDYIFTLTDEVSGKYHSTTETVKFDIPIDCIVYILIIFSALLGLLNYLKDNENDMYITFNKKKHLLVKIINIFTATLPVALIGAFSITIYSGIHLGSFIKLLVYFAFAFMFAFAISFAIRKSTLLNKVLPIISLISIIGVFFIETLYIYFI